MNASTPTKRVPEIIGWEITNRCNLSCPHCLTAATARAHDELTTGECRKVIDAMVSIGVEMIGWTGGEPMLRDDLEELVAYAWSNGIKSNITTNGILFTAERGERLIRSGIRAVQISLDGTTPERNNRMRGSTVEEFDAIIDAIRTCKRLGTRLLLATVVGRENVDDAAEMITLARREGVDAIRFCGFTPMGRGRRNEIKERLQFTKDLEPLLDFVRKGQDERSPSISFDIGFGPVPPDFGFHRCVAGMETFYLKGNGDVYPCTALSDQRFRVGNVRTTPLPDIWNSPEMTAMARFPREDIHGPCRGCDNFADCQGGCRGAVLAITGDLTASFPHCLYRVARATGSRV